MGDLNNEVSALPFTGPWTDIMVDLETTDTAPDRGAILQIGAVKFNLQAGQVSPEFFNMSLTMPPHRRWEESTRTWWGNQKAGVLKNIMQQAQDWRFVMEQLQKFGAANPGLTFWAKPTHFDHSFISSYFKDAGLANPFHYNNCVDMRSYFAGLFYGEENANQIIDQIFKTEFQGDVHNALDDALHQLTMVFEAKRIKDEMVAEAQNNKFRLEGLDK